MQLKQQNQLPYVLGLKPSQLFMKVQSISDLRFKHQFTKVNDHDEPASFKNLLVFQSNANKVCILRELCKSLGVTLEAKDYKLDNNYNICLNQKPQYEWLPFNLINIIEFVPTVKQLTHQNNEVDQIMASANKAFKESMYELAFDLYAQCVSIHVQLQGPLQREAFDCLQRMSRIIYLQGDIMMAIDLQIKAIQLSTVLFGVDHSSTAYGISTLALYYQQAQEYEKSLTLLEKALEIFTLVEGENHPDIAATYVTIGYIFQELDMLYEALDSFLEALYRFMDLLGDESI